MNRNISFQYGKDINFDCLRQLFEQVGWIDKTGDQGRLQKMVMNSQVIFTAWDGQLMVGFGMFLSWCLAPSRREWIADA